MKLEWTIQYGRLVADRFESMARNVKYVIEPDENGWGAKAIRVRDGMKRIDHTPTRMPLQELVEWCEEDAERPEKCPPQPIGPDAPAAETARKMSGKASKFPSTMDASVWASRCTAWFGAFKVPPQEELAPWFDAAILCGLRAGHKAGLCEAESKSPSPPAPEPRRSLEERTKPMSCWPPERLRELQKRVGECEHRIGSTFMAPESNLSGEFVKLNERLRGMDRRLAELENWLGTKKLAPERNFAFETWSRLEQLEQQLHWAEVNLVQLDGRVLRAEARAARTDAYAKNPEAKP